VANRADKLCIITDIGYDHMNILGHTLAEIAAQKIGIVHDKNPVIMYRQSAEVTGVVETWIGQHQAELHATTEADERAAYGTAFIANMPDFQQRNWLLAYAAYRFLQARDSLPALFQAQLAATQSKQVPARMDIRQVGDKTIVMDGAHNGQKMAMFLESFKTRYPDTTPAVLIALKQGKEPADVVPLLASFAARTIVTTFDTSQDLPATSIDPEKLAVLFRQAGATEVLAEPNHLAYQQLLHSPENVLIITGSFYLLGQVRQAEKLAANR
jgi:dihydrofolate synthase/folylpolyglutamate synthase